MVYGYVYWLTKLKNERCFASNKTLAGLAKMTAGGVSNSLTRLERAGFIKRRYPAGGSRNGRTEIIALLKVVKVSSANDTPIHQPMIDHSSADEQKESIEGEHISEHGSQGDLKPEKPIKAVKYPHSTEVFRLWGAFPGNWGANTTERKAAENLYRERGIEKIKAALAFYEKNKDAEMCPLIVKPSDLDRKWENLRNFKKRV